MEWNSENMIGIVKNRFKDLEHKGWDWRSFYNGWLEGRADMLQYVKKPTDKELDNLAECYYLSHSTVTIDGISKHRDIEDIKNIFKYLLENT